MTNTNKYNSYYKDVLNRLQGADKPSVSRCDHRPITASIRCIRLGFKTILLSSLLLGGIGVSQADLVDVSPKLLTMNDELRKDIQQTLHHLRFDHYTPNELNDDYSARTLDGYIKLLDPNKIYFSKKDVDKFQAYRYRLDDLLKQNDAEIAFDIFKVFRERMSQRTELILKLINQDFDFTVNDTINIDRENYKWSNNDADLAVAWEKRIKNDTLQQLMAQTPLKEVRKT